MNNNRFNDQYLLIDLNSRFLKQLQNLGTVLQNIKIAMGIQFSLNVHNQFKIYGIDSYDVHLLYTRNHKQFDYQNEFKGFKEALHSVIMNKGVDDNLESKLVKALALIACQAQKSKTSTRISLITNNIHLDQSAFSHFLSICTHFSKNNIRLDLIHLNLEQLRVQSQTSTIGLEGIKIGVQVTQGIYHQVNPDQIASKLLAQILLSTFNPGEQFGFYQPKIQQLQYQAFCSCCSKTAKELAYVCSNCLAIHCNNQHDICANCKCRFIL